MGFGEEENSSGKLMKCSNAGKVSDARDPVDRITELPESIIFHILAFLPTVSVVATSFLSKSWRFRWKEVTSLDFDDRLFDDCHFFESFSPTPELPSLPLKTGFVNFVGIVLLKQSAESSNINAFSLKWDYHDVRSLYLDGWMNTLIARNVRVLDLDVSSRKFAKGYRELPLPAAVYTCGSLEFLRLRGHFRVEDFHVVCLPKLLVLELNWVTYQSDGSIQKLISGCPVLESLQILRNYCSNFNDDMEVCTISSLVLKRLRILFRSNRLSDRWGHSDDEDLPFKLDIQTPALEYLDLSDGLSKGIHIHELPSLNEVKLNILSFAEGIDIFELIQRFDNVKILELAWGSLKAISQTTKLLSAPFERLTTLVIKFDHNFLWRCLVDLLDCCVLLEVLDISKIYIGDNHWRDPVDVPKCMLSTLRRVSYRGFRGYHGEFGMLMFILNHGLAMNRVDLSSARPYSDLSDQWSLSVKEARNLLDRILKLSRASPTCEISVDGFRNI